MTETPFEWMQDVEPETVAPIHDEPPPSFMDQLDGVTGGERESKPDEPQIDFLKKKRRAKNEAHYQAKAGQLLNTLIHFTAPNPGTIADAAALLQHGDNAVEKIGTLAAHDERVARALDYITDGTENPYLAATFAAAPIILQVLRNHEPMLEPKTRGIRIPFLKNADGQPRRYRLPIKLGVRLQGLRRMTNEPDALVKYVFGKPEVQRKMKDAGIDVAHH